MYHWKRRNKTRHFHRLCTIKHERTCPWNKILILFPTFFLKYFLSRLIRWKNDKTFQLSLVSFYYDTRHLLIKEQASELAVCWESPRLAAHTIVLFDLSRTCSHTLQKSFLQQFSSWQGEHSLGGMATTEDHSIGERFLALPELIESLLPFIDTGTTSSLCKAYKPTIALKFSREQLSGANWSAEPVLPSRT